MFTSDGEGWTERGVLAPSDTAAELAFGTAVDLYAGTIVVGAGGPGLDFVDSHDAAYIFAGAGDQWTEQAKLTPAEAHVNNRFGQSVAIVGDSTGQGAAYLFVPGQDAPAAPAIGVTPGELAAEVNPGGSTSEQLTITNSGGQDLRWEIDTESTASGLLRPAGTATVVRIPAATDVGDESDSATGWTVAAGAEPPGAPTEPDAARDKSPQAMDAAEDVRLTHSTSMEIGDGGVPVCTNNLAGTRKPVPAHLHLGGLRHRGCVRRHRGHLRYAPGDARGGTHREPLHRRRRLRVHEPDPAGVDEGQPRGCARHLVTVPVPARVPAGATWSWRSWRPTWKAWASSLQGRTAHVSG